MKIQSENRNWSLIITILLMVSIVTGAILFFPEGTRANALSERAPNRTALITVPYTTYEWWFLTWSHSQLICQIYTEHEGLPDYSEIEYYCGERVLDDWLDTPPCVFSEQIIDSSHCPGLYLHLASVTPAEREIEVALMPPSVFIDITNCNPQPPENHCETQPSLHLVAEEPLPNEQIINIQGYIGAEPFSCEGNDCTVPLPATGIGGVQANFWADSSYGDSSEVYSAQIRVIPWGDFGAPDVQSSDHPQYYVDVLSSQFMGNTQSTCSEIWSAFPPVGGPPSWLVSQDHPEALITNEPYYFLAGSLISQGVVNANMCPDGGLQTPWIANQCGLEASRQKISEWQNQFDSEIIRVANETGVPSQLIKNVFSQESQFWPGPSSSYKEAGLGHLSDLGADTVLLWNPSFFSQFCPLILDTTECQKGFGNLDIAEQEMLRGALVQKVNAACPDCPEGIDLSKANFSISIFARSLLANCEQVGQIFYNETGRTAGEIAFYEDLWKFTLVNYNAGSGCLTNAIQQAINSNYPLTWENVSLFLEPGACQASIEYVDNISYMPQPQIEYLSSEPTVEPTPRLAPTTQPDPQITPTPTEPAYPIPEPTTTESYP